MIEMNSDINEKKPVPFSFNEIVVVSTQTNDFLPRKSLEGAALQARNSTFSTKTEN